MFFQFIFVWLTLCFYNPITQAMEEPAVLHVVNSHVQGRYASGTKTPVAVLGVPYLIKIADSRVKRYLAKRSYEKVELTEDKKTEALFIFKQADWEDDNRRNYIRLVTINGDCVNEDIGCRSGEGRNNQRRCELSIGGEEGISRQLDVQILFKNTENDLHPCYLISDTCDGKNIANFSDAPSNCRWRLKPHFNFKPLRNRILDVDTFLINLSRIVKHCKTLFLTSEQIRLLCELHENIGISIEKESEKICSIATSDMLYKTGIFICATGCDLRLDNLDGCLIGVGKLVSDAKSHPREYGEEESCELKTTEIAYVKPNAARALLGNIRFSYGELPWYSCGRIWSSCGRIQYTSDGMTIKQLCGEEGGESKLTNRHFMEFDGDTITVRAIGNTIPDVGTVAFLTHVVTQNTIKGVGKELKEAVKEATEGLGSASKSLNNTLLEISKDLNKTVLFAVESLNNRLAQAIRTFETSIQLLTAMVTDTTGELKETAEIMGDDLVEVADKLKTALSTTSRNIKEGVESISLGMGTTSRNIKEGITNASRSFENAFKKVAEALKTVSKDIKGLPNEIKKAEILDAIKKASGDFATGMSRLQEAAQEMKNIKHKHKVNHCAIC